MFGFLKSWKEQASRAKQIQEELCVAFKESTGSNFMNLNPILHNCILKEAIVLGAEKAIDNFIALSTSIEAYDGDVSEEQKAKLLMAIYAERAKKIES
jgi:hypothetical protein